jgi:hypothetical protein
MKYNLKRMIFIRIFLIKPLYMIKRPIQNNIEPKGQTTYLTQAKVPNSVTNLT